MNNEAFTVRELNMMWAALRSHRADWLQCTASQERRERVQDYSDIMSKIGRMLRVTLENEGEVVA